MERVGRVAPFAVSAPRPHADRLHDHHRRRTAPTESPRSASPRPKDRPSTSCTCHIVRRSSSRLLLRLGEGTTESLGNARHFRRTLRTWLHRRLHVLARFRSVAVRLKSSFRFPLRYVRRPHQRSAPTAIAHSHAQCRHGGAETLARSSRCVSTSYRSVDR